RLLRPPMPEVGEQRIFPYIHRRQSCYGGLQGSAAIGVHRREPVLLGGDLQILLIAREASGCRAVGCDRLEDELAHLGSDAGIELSDEPFAPDAGHLAIAEPGKTDELQELALGEDRSAGVDLRSYLEGQTPFEFGINGAGAQ